MRWDLINALNTVTKDWLGKKAWRLRNNPIVLFTLLRIIYKKTDEWYIEWVQQVQQVQQVTTCDNEWYNEWQRMTANDNEWQRVTTSDATSENEWYNKWQRVTTSGKRMTTNGNEWQRMTTSGTTSNKEWQRAMQRVTTSDIKWQWVTVSTSSGTTNENGTVHFKEWVIAILSMTITDKLLLQGMDGCN